MTDPELRQLVESNARTAQAILEAIAEARLEREETRDEFYAGMQRVIAVPLVWYPRLLNASPEQLTQSGKSAAAATASTGRPWTKT